MPTVSYKEKVALIPPELFPLLIVTKYATISLSPFILVPGEPFKVTWNSTWFFQTQPTLDVQVWWNNYLLDKPTDYFILSRGSYYTAGGSRVIQAEDIIPIAKEFYRPGEKQIDLKIAWQGQDWNGTTSGTISSSDWLTVNLDDPVANWWDWPPKKTWMPNEYVDEAYSLSGTVTNRHKFADAQRVTVRLWKWEEGQEDKKKEILSREPEPFSLVTRASKKIDFGDFADHWDWFDCDTLNSNLLKQFRYQVHLEVQDEFDNFYSDDVPQTTGVIVGVSKWARWWAATKCGVNWAGKITKFIGGLFSPASGAVFGGFYYLEDSLRKAVLKVPEPDADFKSKVIRPEIPFDPEDAVFGEGLPATRKFLKVGLEISVLDNMRSSIVGKMLGARHAGQPADERSQRDSYSKVLKELKEKVQTLQKLGDDADAELVELLLKGDGKLPDEIRVEELKGIEKLPPELLDQFMDFLALPDLEKRIRHTQSLSYIAEALSQAVDAIEEEDSKRLAGGSPS